MLTHEELSLLRSQNAHVYIPTGFHPLLNRVVDRAEVEALRGIYRDSQGKIIRSPEWRLKRAQEVRRKRQEYLDRVERCTVLLEELEGPEIQKPFPPSAPPPSVQPPSRTFWQRFWQSFLTLLGLGSR